MYLHNIFKSLDFRVTFGQAALFCRLWSIASHEDLVYEEVSEELHYTDGAVNTLSKGLDFLTGQTNSITHTLLLQPLIVNHLYDKVNVVLSVRSSSESEYNFQTLLL